MIGSSNFGTFKYVELQPEQNRDLICVHQSSYLKSMKPLNVENLSSRKRSDSFSESEKKTLLSFVGQLNWIGTQTRADASFGVCNLSSVFDKSKVEDALRANRVLKNYKKNK